MDFNIFFQIVGIFNNSKTVIQLYRMVAVKIKSRGNNVGTSMNIRVRIITAK